MSTIVEIATMAGVALAIVAGPAAAEGTDLCGFLSAATGAAAGGFASFQPGSSSAFGIRADLIPDEANNCNIGAAESRSVTCFWTHTGSDQALVKDLLDGLSSQAAACLGPSYASRPGNEGGVVLSGPTAQVLTTIYRDEKGDWTTSITVAGLGTRLP